MTPRLRATGTHARRAAFAALSLSLVGCQELDALASVMLLVVYVVGAIVAVFLVSTVVVLGLNIAGLVRRRHSPSWALANMAQGAIILVFAGGSLRRATDFSTGTQRTLVVSILGVAALAVGYASFRRAREAL